MKADINRNNTITNHTTARWGSRFINKMALALLHLATSSAGVSNPFGTRRELSIIG
jgi:hypothetical protein